MTESKKGIKQCCGIFYAFYILPALDEMLTESDAEDIVQKLLPAQNKSFVLGIRLDLPIHEVQVLFQKYPNSLEFLQQIITAFLSQKYSKPTWRVILQALRSDTVKLPVLADKLEAEIVSMIFCTAL